MKKILIVDDTPIVLEGTALSVESFGYSVEKASNGEAAVQLYQSGVFSAILMDCNMPTMTGFECTRRIRVIESETGRHIPIIGFTSSSDSDIREQCRLAGMDAFISKDCSQKILSETLSDWAGQPESISVPIDKMTQAASELVLTVGQVDAISDYFEGAHDPDWIKVTLAA